MTIPQPVLDAYASIVCSNPPPNITGQLVAQATLDTWTGELAGWEQALELTRQQYLAAVNNVQQLQTEVQALRAQLKVPANG